MKVVPGITLFVSLFVAANAASTYNVTLSRPFVVAGKEMKPGDYRVEVIGDKAMIKGGSQSVEAAVKVESGGQKFSKTSVIYDNANGAYQLDQIKIGGTRNTLVFEKGSGTQAEKPAVR
jgi:hypothetical protein